MGIFQTISWNYREGTKIVVYEIMLWKLPLTQTSSITKQKFFIFCFRLKLLCDFTWGIQSKVSVYKEHNLSFSESVFNLSWNTESNYVMILFILMYSFRKNISYYDWSFSLTLSKIPSFELSFSQVSWFYTKSWF